MSSFLHSFSLIKVLLYNFLAKEYWQKTIHKMLVKLKLAPPNLHKLISRYLVDRELWNSIARYIWSEIWYFFVEGGFWRVWIFGIVRPGRRFGCGIFVAWPL